MTDSGPDPVEGERTRAGVAAAAPARAAGLAPADAFRRATRLALGAAGLALGAFEALLERHMPADPRLGPPPPPGPTGRRSGPQGLVRLLPAAAVGLGLEAERRSLDAAAAVGSRITQPLSVLAPAASSWPPQQPSRHRSGPWWPPFSSRSTSTGWSTASTSMRSPLGSTWTRLSSGSICPLWRSRSWTSSTSARSARPGGALARRTRDPRRTRGPRARRTRDPGSFAGRGPGPAGPPGGLRVPARGG